MVRRMMFEALTVDRDNQYLKTDSMIVRAHQQARLGKGGKDQAFPMMATTCATRQQISTPQRRSRPGATARSPFLTMPVSAGIVTRSSDASVALNTSVASPATTDEPCISTASSTSPLPWPGSAECRSDLVLRARPLSAVRPGLRD